MTVVKGCNGSTGWLRGWYGGSWSRTGWNDGHWDYRRWDADSHKEDPPQKQTGDCWMDDGWCDYCWPKQQKESHSWTDYKKGSREKQTGDGWRDDGWYDYGWSKQQEELHVSSSLSQKRVSQASTLSYNKDSKTQNAADDVLASSLLQAALASSFSEKQGEQPAARPRHRPCAAQGARLWCHIFLNKRHPDFELVPMLIGRFGCNMREIYEATNAKIRVRGRGSGHKEVEGNKEAPVPLMVAVTSENGQLGKFRTAVEMTIRKLRDIQEMFVQFGVQRSLGMSLANERLWRFGEMSAGAENILFDLLPVGGVPHLARPGARTFRKEAERRCQVPGASAVAHTQKKPVGSDVVQAAPPLHSKVAHRATLEKSAGVFAETELPWSHGHTMLGLERSVPPPPPPLFPLQMQSAVRAPLPHDGHSSGSYGWCAGCVGNPCFSGQAVEYFGNPWYTPVQETGPPHATPWLASSSQFLEPDWSMSAWASAWSPLPGIVSDFGPTLAASSQPQEEPNQDDNQFEPDAVLQSRIEFQVSEFLYPRDCFGGMDDSCP